MFEDIGAWIKLLHLLSAFCWMAGIFYLPRILVYYRESNSEETRATLQRMGERLYRIIMMPASHITIMCGLFLWWWEGHAGKWIHIKSTCVLLLYVFQYQTNRYRIILANHPTFKSSRFFRVINEIPTLLLIAVLYLVIFKP